jgi:hypothetical protein
MEHHTTIEDLAQLINEAFKATASKENITEVKEEMKVMEDRRATRLDRIEHLLIAE